MLIIEGGEEFLIDAKGVLPAMLLEKELVFFCAEHNCYHLTDEGDAVDLIDIIKKEARAG